MKSSRHAAATGAATCAPTAMSTRNNAIFGLLLVYFIIQLSVTQYITTSRDGNSVNARTVALLAIDVVQLLVCFSALLLNFFSSELLAKHCVFVSTLLFALLCCWMAIATPVVAQLAAFFTLNLLSALTIAVLDTWTFLLADFSTARLPRFAVTTAAASSGRMKAAASSGVGSNTSSSVQQHAIGSVHYGKLISERAASLEDGAEMLPIVAAVADTGTDRSSGSSECKKHDDRISSSSNSNSSFPAGAVPSSSSSGISYAISGIRNRNNNSNNSNRFTDGGVEMQQHSRQYTAGDGIYNGADSTADADITAAAAALVDRHSSNSNSNIGIGYLPRDIDLTRSGMCDGFRVNMHRLPACEGRSVPSDLQWESFQQVQHVVDSSSCHIYSARWGDELVILKLIKAERVQSAVAVAEFETEEHVLSRLQHPNIVRLLGSGSHPRKFLVLELLGGGTLSHSLGISSNIISNIQPTAGGSNSNNNSRGKRWLKKFSLQETLQLALSLASALQYLHNEWSNVAHVIHRDIKPDNIGWSSDGVLKLFDFGLCASVRRQRERTEQYRLTGNTGTLRYMAPEVVLGRSYHKSVDTYSFAILIWQVASGKIPFREMGKKHYFDKVVIGGVRPKLDARWPRGFCELLKCCWHEDKNMRPDFAEVVAELQLLLQEEQMRLQQQSARCGGALSSCSGNNNSGNSSSSSNNCSSGQRVGAICKQLRPVILVLSAGLLLLSFALSADTRNIDASGLLAFLAGFCFYAAAMSYLQVWPVVSSSKRRLLRRSLDTASGSSGVTAVTTTAAATRATAATDAIRTVATTVTAPIAVGDYTNSSSDVIRSSINNSSSAYVKRIAEDDEPTVEFNPMAQHIGIR